MNIKLKALLIALPIAILIQGLVLITGFVMFGEGFNVPVTNIIGVATGYVVYTQLLKKLRLKS